MDTSWIELPNSHPTYINGVTQFLELAKENLVEGKTQCPCKICMLDKWHTIDEVEDHLLFRGFYKSYRNWVFHGMGDILPRMLGQSIRSTGQGSVMNQPAVVGKDDVGGLLNAAFGLNAPQDRSPDEGNDGGPELSDVGPDLYEGTYSQADATDEANATYLKLMECANEELYEGCATFSKLSFLLHLFQLKSMFHWSAESFNMLLKLLVDAFPQIMEFPSSYYEGKKLIKDLGLGYEKIDACPNNCVLYWGDLAEKDKCPNCGTPRWKLAKGKESGGVDDNTLIQKGEPAKVLRYFPLIPRLKRIFMSSKTAKEMTWHDKDREKDGKLRHPTDGLAWKDFDDRYADFASDSRNVRLALASDGFNLFRLMSTTYSTWPVILIPYNLPPWLVMNPSSFLLSMLIPGKSGPGNDIDVYLQPLLHELKILWGGVDAFDADAKEWFKMCTALMCTINDFPAYAMLSGWSTKGYNACPLCTNSTHSYRFTGKICYVGHQKWLPDQHPYRSQGDLFDGTTEYGHAPIPASGTDILRQQEAATYIYGKKEKPQRKKRVRRDIGTSDEGGDGCDMDEEDGDDVLWKKKSIFFELPYWEYNLLRHNLDVMHIEKNVCDNLLGTLLGMGKKCRGNASVRKAIEDIGVKPHLWLQPRPNREPYMPPASYTMSSEEKERFFRVLQKLKVPDRYGSNLSRCVNMKQHKLLKLKSLDNHVLMQDIIPVALRAASAIRVIDILSELSAFFKYLCSTTLDLEELDIVQRRLSLTLCEMEKEFLPTFFTIMVHLLIHLVDEAKLGGPVHYRWMYPIERYLSRLKSYVRNKAQPEGSIAEGYILKETITFCSRYLEGIETIFNRSRRNDDAVENRSLYLFNSGGRVVGMTEVVRLTDRSLKQAHRYVLLHSKEMKDLIDEFIHQKQQQNPRVRVNESIKNDWVVNELSEWLQNKVHDIVDDNDDGKLRKALAGGVNRSVERFKAFMINGYKFHTVERKHLRKTQNSEVIVEADGEVYYGKITDIYELDYYGVYAVIVFRCDWVDINRGISSRPPFVSVKL